MVLSAAQLLNHVTTVKTNTASLASLTILIKDTSKNLRSHVCVHSFENSRVDRLPVEEDVSRSFQALSGKERKATNYVFRFRKDTQYATGANGASLSEPKVRKVRRGNMKAVRRGNARGARRGNASHMSRIATEDRTSAAPTDRAPSAALSSSERLGLPDVPPSSASGGSVQRNNRSPTRNGATPNSGITPTAADQAPVHDEDNNSLYNEPPPIRTPLVERTDGNRSNPVDLTNDDCDSEPSDEPVNEPVHEVTLKTEQDVGDEADMQTRDDGEVADMQTGEAEEVVGEETAVQMCDADEDVATELEEIEHQRKLAELDREDDERARRETKRKREELERVRRESALRRKSSSRALPVTLPSPAASTSAAVQQRGNTVAVGSIEQPEPQIKDKDEEEEEDLDTDNELRAIER